MHVKLAFGETEEKLFFVTTEMLEKDEEARSLSHFVTTYPSEDAFLELLITADLALEKTASLASTVLLSVARPLEQRQSISVELSQAEIEQMRLLR